jgi:hypothetical protein
MSRSKRGCGVQQVTRYRAFQRTGAGKPAPAAEGQRYAAKELPWMFEQRNSMTDTMQAYVISEPGGPERLELRTIPRPSPRDGWVLIRNRAFGLNRSEWFTRRGESPSVRFPRVLGI